MDEIIGGAFLPPFFGVKTTNSTKIRTAGIKSRYNMFECTSCSEVEKNSDKICFNILFSRVISHITYLLPYDKVPHVRTKHVTLIFIFELVHIFWNKCGTIELKLYRQ